MNTKMRTELSIRTVFLPHKSLRCNRIRQQLAFIRNASTLPCVRSSRRSQYRLYVLAQESNLNMTWTPGVPHPMCSAHSVYVTILPGTLVESLPTDTQMSDLPP